MQLTWAASYIQYQPLHSANISNYLILLQRITKQINRSNGISNSTRSLRCLSRTLLGPRNNLSNSVCRSLCSSLWLKTLRLTAQRLHLIPSLPISTPGLRWLRPCMGSYRFLGCLSIYLLCDSRAPPQRYIFCQPPDPPPAPRLEILLILIFARLRATCSHFTCFQSVNRRGHPQASVPELGSWHQFNILQFVHIMILYPEFYC